MFCTAEITSKILYKIVPIYKGGGHKHSLTLFYIAIYKSGKLITFVVPTFDYFNICRSGTV